MKDRTSTPTVTKSTPQTASVLKSFSAGAPRGSWPAEEFAAARRAEGLNVIAVMNLAADTFDVKRVAA